MLELNNVLNWSLPTCLGAFSHRKSCAYQIFRWRLRGQGIFDVLPTESPSGVSRACTSQIPQQYQTGHSHLLNATLQRIQSTHIS